MKFHREMKRTDFRTLLLPLVGLFAVLLCAPAAAATITVNTNGDATADDGVCTLREAIIAANTDAASGATGGECAAGAGQDLIAFSIPGPGPHQIAPTTGFPALSTAMTIDGSTDSGEIELDGNSIPEPFIDSEADPFGLRITGDNVTVNDLTIARWLWGMHITVADTATVSNSRIGTNLAGNPAIGNTAFGIQVADGSTGTVVSDSVISGNGQQGLRIIGSTTTGTRLAGNRIGTNAAGTTAIPNGGGGIRISDASGTEVGGPGPVDGNLISGNTGFGLELTGTVSAGLPEGTLIEGNKIGTDLAGTTDLGNSGAGVRLLGGVLGTDIADNTVSGNGFDGIRFEDLAFSSAGATDTVITGNRIGVGTDDSLIANSFRGISIDLPFDNPTLGNRIGGTTGVSPGGPCTGDCNVIAGNVGSGVFVTGDATEVSILGNEIRDNIDFGINLVPDFGINLNDSGDLDSGPNDLQNFPVIEAALTDPVAGETLVTGRLSSTPTAEYRLEVFENDAADPSGYGEGKALLGAFTQSTDGAGISLFGERLAAEAAATVPLSSTATRTDDTGEYTSEFSLVEAEGCDQSDDGGTGELTAAGDGEALCGLADDDVLKGSTGGDIFSGGEGSDTADLSLSSDPVSADLVAGKIISADGIDLMLSIENLTGSPQADDLTGDTGANTIAGGAGADTVFGGDGDDVIDIADGQADTVVDCGPGNDTVNADSIDIDSASIYTGCETINRPPSSYKCGGLAATIVGTNSAETLTGTSSRDIIVARDGADVVRGNGGNDILCASGGNDTVNGGDGNDLVYGQNGNDKLIGETGKDDMFGGDGQDDLFGGDFADLLDGGNSADLLDGRGGNDILKGKAANDILKGGDSNDTLRGGDGADTLKGDKGTDTLKGENGTDKMFGGDGKDTLFGGSGGKDLLFGQGGFDLLNGGSSGGDVCNGGAAQDRRSAPGCEKRKSIP